MLFFEGAHSRSAAIEQTREGQVRSGCQPTNSLPAKFERAVGAPKWQLRETVTLSPRRFNLHARACEYFEDEAWLGDHQAVITHPTGVTKIAAHLK